jgi:hypothetical protein
MGGSTRQRSFIPLAKQPGVGVGSGNRRTQSDSPISWLAASDFDATVRYEIADMKFLVLVDAKCHKNPMTEGRPSYETRSAQPSDALTREQASGSRVSGTSTMYSGTYEPSTP